MSCVSHTVFFPRNKLEERKRRLTNHEEDNVRLRCLSKAVVRQWALGVQSRVARRSRSSRDLAERRPWLPARKTCRPLRSSPRRLVFPPTGQLVSDQLRSGTWGWKVGAGPGAPLIRIRGVPTPSSVNRGAVALTRWFSKCRLGTLEILSGDPRGENNNNSRLNH